MKPADAILEVESRFIVHHEIGEEVVSRGDDGSEHPTGARNWSRAPCGEPYVVLTSGGVRKEHEPTGVMFSDEARAWRWWYYAVLDYAETVAPENDWPNLHLYWRQKPECSMEEYVSLQQAQALQRGDPLHNVRMGYVYSRLLISKLRPDGTEGP
jgi:hypothetical protein